MKKLWKYIVGFFTFLVGIFILSGRKNQKVKELKKDIKNVEKSIKNKQKQSNTIKKNLESKKKDLDKIKKQKYKKKKVATKDATDFLKKYSKGKK